MTPPSEGRPRPTRQDSNTPHYQTFPTKPPKSRGKTSFLSGPLRRGTDVSYEPDPNKTDSHHTSPLPKRQLGVLAVIALAEQTAFNSISPYLPDMASSFPDISPQDVGLYVGLIASSFALAQFTTNFFWGWLSDRIGRKPVILIGTILTAACFLAFGFCKTLWQAITVHIFMGLVNGNQGVVSSCLGEITDRTNQSTAFKYMPVVYGMGAITGPLLGGLLAKTKDSILVTGKPGFQVSGYPYLMPNLAACGILVLDFIFLAIFLEESLDEAKELPPLDERAANMFTWVWQFMSSSRPSYLRPGRGETFDSNEEAVVDDDDERNSDDLTEVHSVETHHLKAKDIFNRDVLLILTTFLIFQLSSIAYNSLYPIFGQAAAPTGRNLSPKEIGVSQGCAGIITIFFQIGIFGKLRDKIGNKTTYRVGLGGFVLAFLLMPWVGYKDNEGVGIGNGKVWLWIELAGILIIKTLATVSGLTSAMLLITNSAPDHSMLGTLNGLAQTLSAAGRAVGPFISGSLFTAATRIKPKGEAMVFGVFGGIAFLGFLLSFGIRGSKLECDEEDSYPEDASDDDRGGNQDRSNGGNSESTPLMNGRR